MYHVAKEESSEHLLDIQLLSAHAQKQMGVFTVTSHSLPFHVSGGSLSRMVEQHLKI